MRTPRRRTCVGTPLPAGEILHYCEMFAPLLGRGLGGGGAVCSALFPGGEAALVGFSRETT